MPPFSEFNFSTQYLEGVGRDGLGASFSKSIDWMIYREIHGALVTVGGTETGAATGPQEFFALYPLRIALPTTARPLSS